MSRISFRVTRACAMLLVGVLFAAPCHAQTTFTFGGFVKLDALYSKYRDGDVGSESPLRDIHFPARLINASPS